MLEHLPYCKDKQYGKHLFQLFLFRMWADQSPPRKAASSKKGAQKKGKGYKREETFDEVNCSSDR